MTTVRRGIPTERPPLSIEQRLHLAAKRAEQGVAAAAAAQADATAADGRVDDVLSGDEVFSAVNVGGTDVKPFLDKTDGAALVDASALAAEVVETAALSETAVRPGAPATNAAQVNVEGLNTVGGNVNAVGASTAVSTTVTLPAAMDVTLRFTCSFYFTNAETAEFALLVDYAGDHTMQAIRDVLAVDPTRYREVRKDDPAHGAASVSILSTVSLAAGSHTFLVLVMAKLQPNEAVIPAGSASLEVFVR